MGKLSLLCQPRVSLTERPTSCGEPNMYMEPIRCRVTGANAYIPVAAAKPPVWCEDDQANCVRGPSRCSTGINWMATILRPAGMIMKVTLNHPHTTWNVASQMVCWAFYFVREVSNNVLGAQNDIFGWRVAPANHWGLTPSAVDLICASHTFVHPEIALAALARNILSLLPPPWFCLVGSCEVK